MLQLVELPKRQLLNQYFNESDNCLQEAPYKSVQRRRAIGFAGENFFKFLTGRVENFHST